MRLLCFRFFIRFFSRGGGGSLIHKALMTYYSLIFLFSISRNLAERFSAKQRVPVQSLLSDLDHVLGRDLCIHYVQKGHWYWLYLRSVEKSLNITTPPSTLCPYPYPTPKYTIWQLIYFHNTVYALKCPYLCFHIS